MEQANVKVSFYLKKSEADADGMCPVMARLNIGKYSEAAFSLKLRVPQAIWSSGRASGKSVKAKEINNRLDEIRVEKPLYFDPFGQTEFTPLAII